MVQSVEHIACSFPSFLLLSGSRSLWVPRCCCLCYLFFYIINIYFILSCRPQGAGWFLFRVHHLCVTLVVILSLWTGCYCIIISTPYYIYYIVLVLSVPFIVSTCQSSSLCGLPYAHISLFYVSYVCPFRFCFLR